MNGWFLKQGFNVVLSDEDHKNKDIEAKTVKILKECLWFKNYQQRNVFISNGGSNENLSLKLAAPKS